MEIQLKSEMLKHGDIRMEVEIVFYKLVYKGETLRKKKVLDRVYPSFLEINLFATLDIDISQDPQLALLTNQMNMWLSLKLDAAIEPFLKLNKITIKKEQLQKLSPKIIGQSKRARSHIRRKTDNAHVMETSFDDARFYSLRSVAKPDQINEYEVENKFTPADQGRIYMDQFEKGIINKFNAKVNLDSKYRQTMLTFLDQ